MADSPHITTQVNDAIPISHDASLPGSWRALTGTAAHVYSLNCSQAVLDYYRHVEVRSAAREDLVKEMFPELALLLGASNLGAEDVTKCLELLGVHQGILDDAGLSSTSRSVLAQVGAIAFSFPEWRFLAQTPPHSGSERVRTLLEHVGMHRLVRDNDRRGETTPEDPPSLATPHDFGPGFESVNGPYRFELRRAYALLSEREVPDAITLLMRNSSPYFGRNRLEHGAYVSLRALNDAELRGLSRSDIEGRSWFVPLEELLANSMVDRQLAVSLLARLDSLCEAFYSWRADLGERLFSLQALRQEQPLVPRSVREGVCGLLRSMLHAHTGSSGALLLLPRQGPTFPALAALSVTRDLVDRLSGGDSLPANEECERFLHIARTEDCRCALLSSSQGDWPR